MKTNYSPRDWELWAAPALLAAFSVQAASVTPISSPAGFSSGSTTINFDGEANIANSLYSALGVEFGRDDGQAIVIFDWNIPGSTTTSPANVLGSISGLAPTYVDYVDLNFSSPRYEVGAYFGNDQAPSFQGVTLSVFSSTNAFLGSTTVSANGNTSIDQFIGLRSDTPFSRARFQVNQTSLNFAVVLDDVIYGPVPEPNSALLMALGIIATLSLRKGLKERLSTSN